MYDLGEEKELLKKKILDSYTYFEDFQKNYQDFHKLSEEEVCYYHGGKLGSTKARRARRQAALRHGFYTKENVAKRKQISKLIKDSKNFFGSF